MEVDALSETTYQDRPLPSRNQRWGARDEPLTDTEEAAPTSPPPPFHRHRPSKASPAGSQTGALARNGTIGGATIRSTILDTLHPAYYRLYWKPATALPSLEPVDDNDPSLSSFFVEHVPPPRKGKNFLAFVCDREKIHITRAKLYVNTIGLAGEEQLRRVHPMETLKQAPNSCGATPDNPLLVTIEMAPDSQGVRHRDNAATPLPIALRTSRVMGKAIIGLVKKSKNTGDVEMASESSTTKREFLPTSYYEPFLSNASKARKPSPIRGLYPLESIPGMISLLAGKPAPQTFPVTSISVTVRSPFDPTQETQLTIKDGALAESLQYTATKGIPSLLNWVDRLQQIYHNRYSAGEGWSISVGTGSQDLLYKAFNALLNPGDPIFIEAPVYGGVIPILEALKCELVEIPTDAEGIQTADLRTMLESWPEGRPRPRVIYTVPYGCNPTGTTASLERRKDLLALARKYQILILEDDPYYYLYYGEQERPPSYFKLEAEDGHPVGQVLRFDSLSKILSAGLRLGFVSGPSRVVDAIATHTSSANLQTSSTAQAIAFAMLSHFGYEGFEKHTEYVSQYYREKRDVFEAAMNKHLTGLVEWSTPVSGMFIWFKLKLRPTANSPEGDSAALIRERAVAKGVLALPGTAFFPNGQTSAYVRAAFSLLGPEDVDEAMRRLALVIKEYNAEGEQT